MLPVIQADVQLLSIDKFVEIQKADPLCERMTAIVGELETQLDTDENGVLVRRAIIDGSLQEVVPAKLRKTVLYNAQNPVAAEHPGSRGMNETIWRANDWRHMANDVY